MEYLDWIAEHPFITIFAMMIIGETIIKTVKALRG